MALEELGDIRSLIVEGLVLATHDNGQVQTIDVQTHGGMIHAGVEVMQAFGFASVPPAPKTVALLLAVGGDPANLRALPLSASGARFGRLANGEGVLYGADGSRVAVRKGGLIEVLAGSTVHVKVGPVEFNVTASRIETVGDLKVGGNLIWTGEAKTEDGSALKISSPVTVDNEMTVTGAIHGTADIAEKAHSLG